MKEHPELPPDHASRMDRLRLCFDGLSTGDGFGGIVAPGTGRAGIPEEWLESREAISI
jgi:hypothetical protein